MFCYLGYYHIIVSKLTKWPLATTHGNCKTQHNHTHLSQANTILLSTPLQLIVQQDQLSQDIGKGSKTVFTM